MVQIAPHGLHKVFCGVASVATWLKKTTEERIIHGFTQRMLSWSVEVALFCSSSESKNELVVGTMISVANFEGHHLLAKLQSHRSC
jgi:hypothetical protein